MAAAASAASVLPVPVPVAVPLATRVGRALHTALAAAGAATVAGSLTVAVPVSVRGGDTGAERSERAGGERQGTQPGRRAPHTWHGDAPFNELVPSFLCRQADGSTLSRPVKMPAARDERIVQ
jgi:hypothetical protein